MAVNSFNAQNPPLTTKGDLFTFSTIPTRVGVGANDTVLTADSAEATGLKWAAPAGAGFVGVSLFKSANQSIVSGAGAVVTFDSELFDTDGFHSTVTNTGRITIPAGKGGKYLLTGKGIWNASGTGQRISSIRKNSTSINICRYVINNQSAGADATVIVQTIVNLIATDFVTFECFQDGSGSLDLQGFDERDTTFSAIFLGA